MLEYLYIFPGFVTCANWSLPSTLCAPQLRRLDLCHFTFPVGCPLPAGLVTLLLRWIHPSTDCSPNELLQQLSRLSQLETLKINFDLPLPDGVVERQLSRTPLSTHATLPSLHSFMFNGPLLYIKSVLPRITMPFLKIAEVFPLTPHNPALSMPLVLLSVYKTENPRFRDVRVTFHVSFVHMMMYPHEGMRVPALCMQYGCGASLLGLVSTVQRFHAMGPVFSEVELLTLEDKTPSGLHKNFSVRANWRKLLVFFNKVRTVHVAGGDLIEQLSHYLQPHDGESAIELLPMLSMVSCPEGSHVGESCRSFLAARCDAGYPVTISHY